MTMNSKPAYGLDEAAELLGVSRAYINRLVRAGELRVARIGPRTVRLTDEALRDFLRSRETTGTMKAVGGAVSGGFGKGSKVSGA